MSSTTQGLDEASGGTAEVARSVADVITDVLHRDIALEIKPDEAAYIAGIHFYLQGSEEPHLDESRLRDIFVPLNELTHGDPETMQQRCTRMLSRLKAQGVLMRADHGGVASEGEFALSPLGLALGHFIEGERAITSRSLEFMLKRLRAELSQVLDAVQTGGNPEHWDLKIIYPLKYVVAEMVQMIEVRQRGLDADHARLRADIGSLFEQSWGSAVDTCMAMLAQVARTLEELNAVLAEHGEALTRQLNEIADRALEQPAVLRLLTALYTQVSRLMNWSTRRLEAWSSYHGLVHEYIRLVVQVDPMNRMRTRIRDQIRHFAESPHGLCLVAPEPFVRPREVTRPAAQEVVTVPASALENRGLAEYEEPPADPIELALQALLRRLDEAGEIELVPAVMELAEGLDESKWFTLLARATPLLLRRGVAPRELRRLEWVAMGERLEAQSLHIRLPGRCSAAPRQPEEGAVPDVL